MFELDAWKWYVVLGAGSVSLVWVGRAIAQLFTRRSGCAAELREASAVESALYGAAAPDGSRVFDGWSYRVGARFAGRVRVVLDGERMSVSGPRVPRGLYEVWIWLQGLAFAVVFPILAGAAVSLDWRWLVLAALMFFVHWVVSSLGAGLWPGFGELSAVENGRFLAVEFPLECVSEVDLGAGWAKGGLEVVLLSFKAAVDKMAAGRAVSFFAPDEFGREVRYAIHMYSEQDARELHGALARR